jgi:RHS repeat-associated protein
MKPGKEEPMRTEQTYIARNPSNPAVSGTMDGGAAATSSGTPTPVYSYTVAYDGVGNVTGFTDSVMGNWSLAAVPNSSGGTSNGYDTLNRLATMHNTATTSTSSQYAGQHLCWSYDAFGNRIQQSQQSTPCPASGVSSSNSVLSYNSLNQLSGVTPPGGSSASPSPLSYDAAGNVVFDSGPGNTYLYDGEGRVCAVASSGPAGGVLLTGYIYDADGTRVAKGTIERWGSCDPVSNGFQPMTDYILGPGGEQLTEMAMDENGQMAWKHTNVWAGGNLLATYDRDGLHYHLNDWLGTRRVQTDAGGAIEDACASLPYGDALSCIGPTFTTEHHFTGKERDAESGNDYFGARYYASSMGRWMSPDWTAQPDPLPWGELENPQSLNLYAYVRNNPLSRIDPNGHCGEDTYSTNANGDTVVTAHSCPVELTALFLGGDGHHFFPQKLFEGASDLAKNFFKNWKTGPLPNPGDHQGYSTPHRNYTEAIRKLIAQIEEETGKPISQWGKEEIEKAVEEIREAGGGCKVSP